MSSNKKWTWNRNHRNSIQSPSEEMDRLKAQADKILQAQTQTQKQVKKNLQVHKLVKQAQAQTPKLSRFKLPPINSLKSINVPFNGARPQSSSILKPGLNLVRNRVSSFIDKSENIVTKMLQDEEKARASGRIGLIPTPIRPIGPARSSKSPRTGRSLRPAQTPTQDKKNQISGGKKKKSSKK
jgi:hypothetical protein